ncbi:D-alanine--poly(phosphoribitol) ligase subunit DltC [Candidatus Kaiserbacteria bacterium]|nr:D-alanine--poly(phosphoribitol) ligase subunit DltC [Candidatus Kaiserbacteria bacterium]
MNGTGHTAAHVDTPEIRDAVFTVLEHITQTQFSLDDMDANLFDEDLLDSLGLIQTIVTLSEKFNIDTPPASVERDQWSTPRKIITTVTSRLAHANETL